MGKRRKPSKKPSVQLKEVKLLDPTGDDAIYDEIDQFHLQKDKIMLEEGDEEEEVDELADLEDGTENEVLAMSEDESEEEEEDDDQEEDFEKDLPSNKAWGCSKKAFYAADSDEDIRASDEEAMQIVEEEEREAIILQKRLAEKLDADDFHVFEQQEEVEHLKPLEEQVVMDLSKLSRDEKLQIIIKESPELLGLIEEFRERLSELIETVHPLFEMVKKGMISDEREVDFIRTKHALLLNYCVNISFYLALQSSGEVNIKQHPVIARLAQYQQLLLKLETIDEKLRNEIVSRLKKDRKASKSPGMTAIRTKNDPVNKSAPFSLLDHSKKQTKSIVNGNRPLKTSIRTDVDPLEFYKQVEREAQEKKRKKKKDRFADSTDEEDVDVPEVNDDGEGKRAITYKMQKNKGLTRSRRKELRNPRVKHKMKFKKAKIKRRGQVRDVVTEMHRYGGETTGIKAGIAKSVKLKS